MYESLFVTMLICAILLFGVLTLNLGGVVSIGLGWMRITFRRHRHEPKPADRQDEHHDALR
jgi:hypothetical protein